MTNAEIVRDMLHRQYNERDITAVDLLAENHVDHNPTPGQEQGRAGVRTMIEGILEHSEPSVEIHEQLSEGDLVCTRYTLTIAHHGDIFGMPAAGKTTTTRIIEIDRVQNGEIVESWGEFNPLEMMDQLGLLPEGFAGPDHGSG